LKSTIKSIKHLLPILYKFISILIGFILLSISYGLLWDWNRERITRYYGFTDNNLDFLFWIALILGIFLIFFPIVKLIRTKWTNHSINQVSNN